MRSFARIMAVFLALCFTIGWFAMNSQTVASAQEKKVRVHGEKADNELPVKSEYERALKHYADWKDKFDNMDYWKNVTLTRVSDKKEFKVKDLPEFDRQGFFLSNLRRLGFELTRLNGFWQEELKQYTAKPPKQEGVPTTDELKGYIERLTKLRKEAAVKLETYAERFVRDNAAKITKEEGDQLLKQIRSYHDENKLIERK